jgi:hypothetical protein
MGVCALVMFFFCERWTIVYEFAFIDLSMCCFNFKEFNDERNEVVDFDRCRGTDLR